MGFVVVAFLIFCCGCTFVGSVNLKCKITTGKWLIVGSVNYCRVNFQSDFIMDRMNRNVDSIDESSRTRPSVKGIHIEKSNCFYLPLGMQKVFPNLEGIAIENSKLKEIWRDDFTEYKNLSYIDLGSNEIQFLEANLFEFTPKLEVIILNNNKIAHIDANVFDYFTDKLSYLLLSGNICQIKNARNDKSESNLIIATVQSGSCQDKTVLFTITTTASTTISATLVTTSAPFLLVSALVLLKFT